YFIGQDNADPLAGLYAQHERITGRGSHLFSGRILERLGSAAELYLRDRIDRPLTWRARDRPAPKVIRIIRNGKRLGGNRKFNVGCLGGKWRAGAAGAPA